MTHSVANQIVGLTGIINAEVFAVDRELGIDGNTICRNLNIGREDDRFLYAVQIKIAGDRMRRAIAVSMWFNLSRNKSRFRIFSHVKEIRRLKMAGQLIVVGRD